MSCDCRVERPTEERPISILPDPKSAAVFEPEMLPIVQKRIEDCTSMEHARSEDRLNIGQREEMIRHSLYCFARVYDEDTFERLTPVARLIILIGVLVIGACGYYAWTQTGSHLAPILAAIAIGLIFVSLFYWAFRHSPRKRVRTWLAMALLPLDPTTEEIRKARAELQGSRLKAGFQIRTSKLLAKIKKLKAKGVTGKPKSPYA
jgi:HAMP domain-containing protein